MGGGGVVGGYGLQCLTGVRAAREWKGVTGKENRLKTCDWQPAVFGGFFEAVLAVAGWSMVHACFWMLLFGMDEKTIGLEVLDPGV